MLARRDGSLLQRLTAMSFTMTRTTTESFTLTHAKELAAKVVADMRRCQQLYGQPPESRLNDYGTELALLLNERYVANYEFGFLRNGARILSWNYTVDAANEFMPNDRPGRMIAGVDISGASWFNRLNKNSLFWNLPADQRKRVEDELPVQRVISADLPNASGQWTYDRTYTAGGVGLGRKTFHPFA
jgi:hypothetical protein